VSAEDGDPVYGDQPAVETPKKAKSRAAKKAKKGKDAAKESDDEEAELAGAMGLFEAIKKERVKAQFVPQNAALASLTISNPTELPLTLQIPSVLAGSPVLPRGTTEQAYLQTYGAAIPQTVGGVITSRRRNSDENGAQKRKPGGNAAERDETLPANIVTLPPGGQQMFHVACVGLDFGKPSPLPIMPYELVEIDDATKRPEVRLVLEGFAAGRVEQDVAQLASWHFNSGMNWEQLAAGSFPNKLEMAKKVAEQAEKDVKAKAKAKANKEKDKDKVKEKVMAKKPEGKGVKAAAAEAENDDAEMDEAETAKAKPAKKVGAKRAAKNQGEEP
jgi:hypothetical protein